MVTVCCRSDVSATMFNDVIDFLGFERQLRPIGRYADALISYTLLDDDDEDDVVFNR